MTRNIKYKERHIFIYRCQPEQIQLYNACSNVHYNVNDSQNRNIICPKKLLTILATTSIPLVYFLRVNNNKAMWCIDHLTNRITGSLALNTCLREVFLWGVLTCGCFSWSSEVIRHISPKSAESRFLRLTDSLVM